MFFYELSTREILHKIRNLKSRSSQEPLPPTSYEKKYYERYHRSMYNSSERLLYFTSFQCYKFISIPSIASPRKRISGRNYSSPWLSFINNALTLHPTALT